MPGGLFPPEVLEARLAQCRVARGVGDRDVARPIFDGAGVDPVIGELVAPAMPQHVEVNRQRQPGTLADDLHQPVDSIRHFLLFRR